MLIRDGAIYILSRVVPGVVGFATAMLLTWLLPARDYGLYGLGMAVIMLGNFAVFEWLSHGLARWYESHHQDPAFMPTVLALFGGSCLASFLLVAAICASGLIGEYTTEAWLFLYGIWAHGWFEFTSRIQICGFRPMRYLLMNLARNGLILAGAALVAVLTRSGEAVLLVSFTAMLVAGSLFLADGSIRLRRRLDAALARTLLAYGGPIFLSMVFSALMTSVNPVMIGVLSSQEAVGHYTIAFTLVQSTLGMIAQGINVAIWPFAVRAVESGDMAAARTQLSHNFTFLFGLVLPAGTGLALLAPGIARLFISPTYHEAIVQMTPWLSACAVLMALRASYVDAAFQLGKRTGLLARVTGLGALINLGLGALLIPRWSYLGAAIAMTCAFAFSMVHASVLAKRFYPMPLPLREAASITLATGIMGVVVAMALAVPGPLGLLLQVVSGAATYFAALLLLDRLGLSAVLGGGLLARLMPSGRGGMQPPSVRVAPAAPGEAPAKGAGITS